jgi:hypothetical protein
LAEWIACISEVKASIFTLAAISESVGLSLRRIGHLPYELLILCGSSYSRISALAHKVFHRPIAFLNNRLNMWLTICIIHSFLSLGALGAVNEGPKNSFSSFDIETRVLRAVIVLAERLSFTELMRDEQVEQEFLRAGESLVECEVAIAEFQRAVPAICWPVCEASAHRSKSHHWDQQKR